MKTLISLVLSVLTVAAATKPARPAPPNPIQTDAASAPMRKLADRWIDLRPLAQSMTVPGTRPSPAGYKGWEPHYFAKVISVARDGLILDSHTPGVVGRRTIYLRNLPNWQLLKDGDIISFLAHNFGTYNYQSVGGSRTVAGYDYGILPTADEQSAMNARAAEIISANLAAVKAEQEKKVADAKERGAKLRAEREAKERKEKEKQP